MSGSASRFLMQHTVAVLCFASSGALGQMNKCVDAGGKVTYQQQACPGAQPAAAPAPTARPAPAGKQAAAAATAAPGGAPPMPNHAAKECAENWNSFKTWNAQWNKEIAKTTEPGRRFEMKNRAADQMVNFLRPCKRAGFIVAEKPEQWRQNDELATKISADYKSAYERRMAWETEQREKAPPPASFEATRSTVPAPRTGQELSVANQEMNDCAETWNIVGSTRYSRRELLKDLRAKGKGPSAAGAAQEKKQDEAEGARFLATCKKYGFLWPNDDAGDKQNDKLMNQIRAKIDAAREATRNADAKYQLDCGVEQRQRDMASDAARRADERRTLQAECNKELALLAKNRADAANVPDAQRLQYLSQIDKTEREIRKTCDRWETLIGRWTGDRCSPATRPAASLATTYTYSGAAAGATRSRSWTASTRCSSDRD